MDSIYYLCWNQSRVDERGTAVLPRETQRKGFCDTLSLLVLMKSLLLTCSCFFSHMQVWSSTGTPPLETSTLLVPMVNWTPSSCTMTGACWSPTPVLSTVACTTASCSTQRVLHCGRMSSTSVTMVKTFRNWENTSKAAAVLHSGSGGMLGLRRRSRQVFQPSCLQELWLHQCCWPLCWDSALELWAGLMFWGEFRDLRHYWCLLKKF